MKTKTIQCAICKKKIIIDIHINNRKYCDSCGIAISLIKQEYNNKRKAEKKKHVWDSLSEKEKAEILEQASKYYLYESQAKPRKMHSFEGNQIQELKSIESEGGNE